MNITYNDITIPFYDMEQMMINAPVARKGIKLGPEGLPENIIVSLSGGADSASALYLSCKHYPDIHYYPFTMRDIGNNALKDAIAADKIVKYIQNKFPHANLHDIETFDFNDKDPANHVEAQKAIDGVSEDPLLSKDKDEYCNLNLTQMSKIILLHAICDKMISKFYRPMLLDGLTGNPPAEALETFGHKGEDRRNHYKNRLRLKYNRYKPFLNIDKKFVADIYKTNDIMDLFEMTRSCTGTERDTDNYTKECHKCFWCYERKWAFDLIW
tara:strand:+ start:2603 stop:3412 length:810 start_codon:yes stop_codon:yes gene_type:complete